MDDAINISCTINAQMAETVDNFIFEYISPWCENVVQHKLSKKMLERALLEYQANHPEEFNMPKREWGMTREREETIKMFKSMIESKSQLNACGVNNKYDFRVGESYFNFLETAIRALEQIDKIEQIIAIDNTVIQEDVLKYKMICEVLK